MSLFRLFKLFGFDDAGVQHEARVTSVGSQKVSAFDPQSNARQIIDPNGAAKVGEAIILVGDAFGGKTPGALQWQDDFIILLKNRLFNKPYKTL